MEIAGARLRAPTSANVTVRSARPREYLTECEVEKLIDAARDNRWGHRDATAILIAYRHGLRASELVALRWDDLDWRTGKLHVRRSKGGMTSVHPIGGRELRALRRLQREMPDGARTVHIVRFGAPSTAERGRLSAHGCSRGGGRQVHVPDPQPHVAALVWLQTSQRRTRHAGYPALPRAPLDRVHGTLHGIGAGSVQGLLERLSESHRPLPPACGGHARGSAAMRSNSGGVS